MKLISIIANPLYMHDFHCIYWNIFIYWSFHDSIS